MMDKCLLDYAATGTAFAVTGVAPYIEGIVFWTDRLVESATRRTADVEISFAMLVGG